MITERELSPSERAVWLMDQAAPMNGVMMAHVRGPLRAQDLRAGLLRLQERHPLVRAHIEPGQRPRIVTTDARPIPLRTVRRQGGEDWRAEAEAEVNQPFSVGENPLFRAVLIQGEKHNPGDQSELLLTLHHVLCDATSGTLCIRQLLKDAAALSSGAPLPAVEPLPLRPALSDLLAVGAPRMIAQVNSFVWRFLAARARGPRKLRFDAEAPPAGRRTRFVDYTLDPAQTAALSARCKQEGTTVQGVLCAALLLALSADLGDEEGAAGRRPLGCFSAVGMRDRLSEQLGDEVGLFASQATTFHQVPPDRDLWDLGREVRSRLLHVIETGEPYMTFPWLGMFIPWGEDPLPGLLRRVDLRAPFATGITNTGRLPVPTRYGPLLLTRLHMIIGMTLIAPVLLGVTTLESAMSCNLLYAEPLVCRERALAIGERLMGHLRL